MSLKEADFVLALDVDIPWKIGVDAPTDEAFVTVVDQDPSKARIPTMEFTADLRVTANSLFAIEAIDAAIALLVTPSDCAKFNARANRWAEVSAARRRNLKDLPDHFPTANLSIADGCGLKRQTLGDDCIVFDDTIVLNQVHDYLKCSRPGSYFYNPGSSGGWAAGAAFGAKLAALDRDVVAITGDGFYMFGAAVHSLWSAAHYRRTVFNDRLPKPQATTGTLRKSPETIPTALLPKPIILAATSIHRSISRWRHKPLGPTARTSSIPTRSKQPYDEDWNRTRSGQCAVMSFRLPRLLHAD